MTVMSEDVPPQVIKETQTLLGKYIKEPPLSDKLLKKPPFRFLQDIVKSVVKETGFLGDVYTPEELSENIKEKDKKVSFLKKLISATQDATGKTLSVRPSKIVAGLEVAKTLELLQSVATGIALKQSGVFVQHPVSEEKKDKKKSKDSTSQKDAAKKSTKDEKVEDSAKEKPKKRKENGGEKKEVNGEKKRDKVKEVGEIKKRDKSAKEEGVEKKKREKSGKDGDDKNGKKSVKNGEDKERKKSAKDKEDKERRKSAKDLNGEEKKRDKSAKQDKAKERPPSRRPSLDGLEAEGQGSTSNQVEAPSLATSAAALHPTLNGDKIGDLESNVPETIPPSEAPPATAPIPPNVLEESKDNTELAANGSRKSSLDGSKDKADKENREKREKRDRSKDVERKTSSRRSSSKARPSSKNAEKSEKPVKEKTKVEEEPTVLGSGEAPITAAPTMERPQTARKPPPSARPQSMRPPSARPGAPKIRDRGEVKTDVTEPENEVKVVPVITDSDQLQDDENMVTVERQGLSPDFDQGPHFLDAVNKVGENEGALVAQILETKKELEETGQLIGGDSARKPVEIEWEGGRKQKKEAWGREINKLREGIQQLTRSTNPLGKLFDFLQEDVDSMQRELKMWKETNITYNKQLVNERRMTDNSLETYRRQLAELDSLIEQETETLKNMKANVLANDRKIYSILTRTSTD